MNGNKLKKARKAVKLTAKKENLSVSSVRKEMKAAIAEGLLSSDPDVQAIWREIPCRGEAPEPEGLIAWLAEQVKEKLKK